VQILVLKAEIDWFLQSVKMKKKKLDWPGSEWAKSHYLIGARQWKCGAAVCRSVRRLRLSKVRREKRAFSSPERVVSLKETDS
jgi:hypothetical protein